MGKLTFIPQSQNNDCALACIKMIAGYYGIIPDIGINKGRIMMKAHGLTLMDIVVISSSIGLTTRAFRLDCLDLKRLNVPAIIHWKSKHFVVMANSFAVDGLTSILDPSYGKREIDNRSLCYGFTGFALELIPDPIHKNV